LVEKELQEHLITLSLDGNVRAERLVSIVSNLTDKQLTAFNSILQRQSQCHNECNLLISNEKVAIFLEYLLKFIVNNFLVIIRANLILI
jgi:hypothetical protein